MPKKKSVKKKASIKKTIKHVKIVKKPGKKVSTIERRAETIHSTHTPRRSEQSKEVHSSLVVHGCCASAELAIIPITNMTVQIVESIFIRLPPKK